MDAATDVDTPDVIVDPTVGLTEAQVAERIAAG